MREEVGLQIKNKKNMQTINALRKLEREGWSVKERDGGKYHRTFIAEKPGFENFIELMTQGDNISIIDLRRYGMEDDVMTDYHAGTFCRNLAQAIRFANSSYSQKIQV